MAELANLKQEITRIADDISKNQNEIFSQLRQLEDMKNAIAAIMGGTSTGADRRIVGLIEDAAAKGKTAQVKLREASARMKKWATDGGLISTMPTSLATSTSLSPKRGGAYSELKTISDSSFEQVHHMPAKSTSPLSVQNGPAIIMRLEDHTLTASFDNRRGSKEYRLRQQELIQSNRFFEAFMMDVNDVRYLFGNHYDSEIQAAQEYIQRLIERGIIN